MTWEEVAAVLISYGEPVRIIRGSGLDTVALQIVPVGWFVSIKSAGELCTGLYGEDLRLVGQRAIPLAELTEEILRMEVGAVMLHALAMSLCHSWGMPWTDRRTGVTHDPPEPATPPAPRRI